jgi:hypothetical protein
MMNKIVVENNQSVVDIAVQISGGVEGLIPLIACNAQLSIESNLRGGVILSHNIEPTQITEYLRKRNIKPATADIYNAPFWDGQFTDDFNNEFE